MGFLKKKILKNLSFYNYLIIFLFFLYSIFIISYQYDGHHFGLIYSNAIDLINGKLPYKEIFIQYGFLTTLIHSLILLIFKSKIFFISFFNAMAFSIGIFLISRTLKNLVNNKYAFISTILILANHPIPWLPWPNYLAFFFISISIFLLSKNKINLFWVGLFFSLATLSRQDFFIPIFLSFLIFCFFAIFDKNNIYIKNVFKILLGFTFPIIIFLSYLYFLDIHEIWFNYLIIPQYYLEIYDTKIIRLVSDFIIFFFTESFFNFIITPQFYLISIILISNLILILLKIFNKIKIENNILFIILLSSFLSLVSLKIELFRLFTSVIFGIIPLLYFISKINDQYLRKNFKLLILLPSIFSFFFYPLGNNSAFSKIDFELTHKKIINKKFDFHKWPHAKVNSINIVSDITNKCNVEYLENLTFDSILSTIGNYNRIRLAPYVKASEKDSKFFLYVDSLKNSNDNFIDLINTEIKKENIILLINKNNDKYNNNVIKISPSYNEIKINQSDIVGKPNILRVYIPSKCQK